MYAGSNESVARERDRERERSRGACTGFVQFRSPRERMRGRAYAMQSVSECACRAQVSWECSDAVCIVVDLLV